MDITALPPAVGMALFGILSLWPVRRILIRAGLNPLWAWVVLAPLVGHAIVYGALALTSWPNRPQPAPKPAPKARRTA